MVHTAPGHGQEDYATGLKYGLPIVSPVDDGGNFTEEAGQFRGLSVLGEGNSAVVSYLDENMSLVMEESYGELAADAFWPNVLANNFHSLCFRLKDDLIYFLFMQLINTHMIGELRNQRSLERLSSGLHRLKDFARPQWMQSTT